MKKIFMIMILILCVTGCDNGNKNNKEPEVDLKAQEFIKLREALTNSGFDGENDYFDKKIAEKYDEDGLIIILNAEYFDIKKLTASQNFTNHNITRTSLITDYSFRTDTATGTFTFFDENEKIENVHNFTYDFNNGTTNCTAAIGSCSENGYLSSLKNTWLSFMVENDIDIELLK